MDKRTARLLVSCSDGRGIIASVTGFVAEHAGNILDADQHTDPQHGEFFMRVEIEKEGFRLDERTFEAAWRPVAERHGMRWRISWGNRIKRMAILASKESHCLSDLLWRWRAGELRVEVAFVAGNHPDTQAHAEACGAAFHYLPLTPETRADQERRLATLLDEERVDFVVLARYMQILSPPLVARYRDRMINIHHSFLPAFAGPKPYHQAYARGVKIIGATSHYVTDELDEGPIIAQATMPVDHRDTIDDLIRKGRDLERIVLATAVRHHVEDEILVNQNRTVVFD